MMGRSHLISGVVSGLAVCAVIDVPAAMLPVFVAVSAYSALTPDLDHPAAPAARVLGPVSWGLCWLVRNVSARTTGATHRGITHSVVFALVWGVLVGLAAVAAFPVQVALWLSAAAFLGCLTHIAGDVLTLSGCQHVLWPSSVQVSVPRSVQVRLWPVQVWLTIPIRFRTGSTFETRFVVGALITGGVLLLPAVLT